MSDKHPDAQACFEVTIFLKGEDQSYKRKFLCYEESFISQDDPIIKDLIESCKKECKFEIEEVKVKASF